MNITKSRIIFFAIALTYNLLLGLYLKDFLVLSKALTAFYLLSVLPTFFLLIEARSRPMNAIVYIVLVLDIFTNVIYYICCRRLLAVMTMVFLVVELMCFVTFANRPRKDNLLTKICVLTVTALILVKISFVYNFVQKPEVPYLSNGDATLWDTETEKLADKFVPTVKPTKIRSKQSISGSSITSSTTMTTAHSSSMSMFAKHYVPINVSATTSPISSQPSAAVRISLAVLLSECHTKPPPSICGTASTITTPGGIWT